MKKPIFLLFAGLLYFWPMNTGIAQKDAENSGNRESIIRSKIRANLDSTVTLVSEKIIKAQSKAPVIVRRKGHTIIIRDTIYIDTCFNKQAQLRLEPIRDTFSLIKLPPTEKKESWLRRIFHKKNKQKK